MCTYCLGSFCVPVDVNATQGVILYVPLAPLGVLVSRPSPLQAVLGISSTCLILCPLTIDAGPNSYSAIGCQLHNVSSAIRCPAGQERSFVSNQNSSLWPQISPIALSLALAIAVLSLAQAFARLQRAPCIISCIFLTPYPPCLLLQPLQPAHPCGSDGCSCGRERQWQEHGGGADSALLW